jgi:S1-C subfamily serine protease
MLAAVSSPRAQRRPLQWLVAVPALLLGGVWLGRILPVPEREPVAAGSPPPAASLTIPSWAPIVDRVRAGVVGVIARRRPDPDRSQPAGLEQAGRTDASGWANGTGFVIDGGHIVTNHHLVAGATQVIVDLSDHAKCEAEVIGEDLATDIALLRVEDPPEPLVPLRLGDSSQVRQGDWVLAVGNPFLYFRHSVTVGVVSYVGRLLPEDGLQVTNEYLQFSAPVNPGSSGGPVLDARGDVVGVTTRTHSGGQGLSFAVPSKVLQWVLEAMKRDGGRVRRGYLGLSFQPRNVGQGGGQDDGALVTSVTAGGPAALAGLQIGDRIVGFGRRPVASAYDLHDWITHGVPGSDLTLEVLRGDQRLTLPARLAELPATREDVETPAPIGTLENAR